MEVRLATALDIPEIVGLLKVSLGESLMPKSEQYWKWKHFDNPFGSSPVLVCYEGNKLVGVRAFMQWKWIKEQHVYHAVRAVDTATHPEFQGKGIFKKLTLQLATSCEHNGIDFVFNTPNKQSKPGYLKMGWVEAGKLPVYAEVCKPIQVLKNIVFNPRHNRADSDDSLKYYLAHKHLESLLRSHLRESKGIVTKVSIPYLKWRYMDVPVAEYVAIGEEQGENLVGLVIARIKQTRLGNELRITDVFLRGNEPGEELIRRYKDLKRLRAIDYCTLSGQMTSFSKPLGLLSLKMAIGPIVTWRSLLMKDFNPFKNFKNWSPSLGDLELF